VFEKTAAELLDPAYGHRKRNREEPVEPTA
jgi:hypothetical protein